MPNQEQLGVIKAGAVRWNRWKKQHPDEYLNLEEADLNGANLSGSNLAHACLNKTNLSKANLSMADLSGAHFCNANLSGADLTGAKLTYAEFYQADLRWANLGKADLTDATFIEAEISEANFSDSILWKANFAKANLQKAELISAKLREANFFQARVDESNFNGADLQRANFTNANVRMTKFVASDLNEAIFLDANLSYADLSAANLAGADLSEATLVGVNLENSNLTGCRVYGVSAWNLNTNKHTQQTGLIITPEIEPTIRVDELALAQFIYLLQDNENLRNILNAVTQNGVLILGRFGGGGIHVLHELADALRQLGYLPIIFEFERPNDRNYTETVRTLAGLARFVVVDLSGPSVPQELFATVPYLKIPFVPILENGRRPYSMFADLQEYDWVLKPVEFDSIFSLTQELQAKIVNPAEQRIKTRQAKLREIFG